MESTTSSSLESLTVAVIGMNAAGKTNFGKRLASKLKLQRIDIDTRFQQVHGDPEHFIEQHGWPAFRQAEGKIVSESLLPGALLVLGGGAVESETVRALLQEHALVIWMQSGLKRTVKHLSQAKRQRPEFKGTSLEERAKALLAAREPYYKELADITLLERLSFAEQIPVAIAEIKKHLAQ